MGSSVKIILDNGHHVCCPGQTIVGKVICNFRTEKTVRAIRIKFKGRAKTKWTTGGGRSSTTYFGEELYFNAEYNLLGGDPSQDISIPAGTHMYPFSYILPPSLPTSFTGSDGNIKYKIKAKIDIPWKFDYENKVYLFVDSPLDLNYIPRVREPFFQSIEDTLDFCCINSGSILFSVSLPATGYARGQCIDVYTSIQNMSSTSISNVLYEIKRSNEFISQVPSTCNKHTESVIASNASGPIGPNAEKSWTMPLYIPSQRVANLLSCSIINISYRLKVKVVLPFPYGNLKISCPLTLGTVPLSGVHTNIPGPPSQRNSNSSVRISLRDDTPFLQDVGDNLHGPQTSASAPPPSYADVKN